MDDILQVNERLRGLIWGAPHADFAARHRIVLHGGDRSFSGAVLHALAAENTVFLLYRCCKTDKRRRFSVCGHVHCACRDGRHGNIAGVATALTLGGPGAVFWLWVSAFVGMMTAFAENTLGMLYREKGSDGSWRGGAMLYLKNGLRSPLLAGALRCSACWHRSVSAT